jgi:hypothetical protein
VLSGYEVFFWGAGATVETVKAKVGNDMNSHDDHGDLVADAAAPSAKRLDDSID